MHGLTIWVARFFRSELMRETPDPKAMAKFLRAALALQGVALSHSACLELVAQQLGYSDWNTAAAMLEDKADKPLPKLILPNGWHVAGSQAQDYHIGVDEDEPGSPATIKAIHRGGSQAGFATLMQSVLAERFRGQRLRLTVDLRSLDAAGAATLWMRVDDDLGRNIRFDNMEKRTVEGVLTGTTGWVSRAIVLDIPEAAESINYGFYLRGLGQVWARSFDLRQVGDEVPITASGTPHLLEPMNLDFAERSLRGVVRG
jgi:hypothetical protein